MLPMISGQELQRAYAEIERLRAALEPFAMLEIPDYVPDEAMLIITDTGGGIIPSNTPNYIQAGDVREARRALEPK